MLTVILFSFAVISLMMIAMGVGLLCGKLGIGSTCGSNVDGLSKPRNDDNRCGSCVLPAQRRCSGKC